jgi:hypothetical protein
MEEFSPFLKYIYQEDIYLIDEPAVLHDNDAAQESAEPVNMQEEVHEPQPVKYLGSNNKGILILVNDTESEFLNSKDLDFLMRIIESGLKLSKTDIGVVNCLKNPYSQIFDELHHSHIIAFGNHQTEKLNGKTRSEVVEEDGIKILLADELKDLEDDRDRKTVLWKALQRMFELN